MALISLVYVSVAAQPMSDDQLQEILRESRDNNEPRSITGMLLYRDGFFIQALEGDEDAVIPLFESIRTDARHRNVLMVYKNRIESRTFSNWSMGFNKISDTQVEDLPGFTDFLTNPSDMSFFTDHPDRATGLLESFKNKTYF